LLPQALLQLTPGHEDIEQLILTAHLNIGFLGYGVVSLHERVEELVEVDGLTGVDTLAEVLTYQELLDGEIACKADDVGKVEGGEPFVITTHAGQIPIQNFEGLLGIGTGMFVHLLYCQLVAGFVFVRGVADEAGERADQEGDIVAELLEL